MTSSTEPAPSLCAPGGTCDAKYKILIVNDDGIDAPGIRFLAEALAEDPAYDIRVSAPATGQSGVAAKITLGGEIRATPRPGLFQNVAWAVAVAGSPVDSLRVGLRLCGSSWQPDLVLSGVNLGNNLGMCTLYSGTVSAALDSALLGFPSVAFSYDVPSYERPATESEIADMGTVVRAVCPAIVEKFRTHGVPELHVANVNIPHPGVKRGGSPVLKLAIQSMSVLKSGYSDTETEGILKAKMTSLDTETEGILKAKMTSLDTERARGVDPRIASMNLPLDVDVVESGDMSVTLTPAWPHADIVSAYTNTSEWI